jgi:RNA polymerase sigma-70 factor (ECF subfamily)
MHVTESGDGEVTLSMELEVDELVHRARAGDVPSFGLLVERFYPRLLRYAMRMLGNRADAEEAVQDTLVRAHRSLARYEERAQFEPWLFRILLNQCRTLGAKRRRRDQTFVPYGVESGAAPAPSGTELQWQVDVQGALMRLAPEAREALLLKFVEDKSYEDMADLTGVGVSALKMRVKRAREQLRAYLREDGDAG